MLRSQEMSLILLFINRDTARHSIAQIGSSHILHFVNLNKKIKPEHLNFNNQLKQLEKIKQRLKYLTDEVCDGSVKLNKNTNKSYLKVEEEVNKHYTRYLSLKEMCKDSMQSVNNMCEAVLVLEELENFLCVDMCPTNFEECLKNLDYVCFTIARDRAVLVERVLKQVLRGNVVFKKSEQDDVNIYLVFTHGKVAVNAIKNVVVSLQGRCVDDVTLSRGCLNARTKLVQIQKVLSNNRKVIDEEEMEIRQMIGVWKYVVEKEIKVLTAMNKMRVSHNMMVGQGWILKKSIKKFAKICEMLSKKMGCISFQVMETFDQNSHLYDNEGESNEDLESDPGNYDFVIVNNTEDIISKGPLNTVEISNISSLGVQANNSQITNIQNTNLCEISGTNEEKPETKSSHQEQDENMHITELSSVDVITNETSKSTVNSIEKNNNKQDINQVKAKSKETGKKKQLIEESVNLMDEVEFKLLDLTRPPTCFPSNKVTACFQALNNVYGIPRYKELNPAIFQAAIFPFLFGAMFGDAFHGIILMCLALYMIKYENTMKPPEIFEMVFAGRYALFLCGVWSLFFGFIYSDFAGFAIKIIPSQYENVNGQFIRKDNYTFPFGIDHAFESKTLNGSAFRNSFKMKFAIITGFIHMTFGSLIAVLNAIYSKDYQTLYLVILPQYVIFFCIVGYLVFLILYKWIITHDQALLNVLLDMFQSPFSKTQEIYKSQHRVQLVLLSIIICLFPFLLISKPLYIMRVKKKNIWLHHIIESSEYGIGLVSNISSYLRLWAVSLAHGELTSVMNEYLLPNNFTVIFTLPAYLIFTLVLLIGLEGMSSSLHALRLNWIEFGGQFYKGDGYRFKPLRFDIDDDGDDDDEDE